VLEERGLGGVSELPERPQEPRRGDTWWAHRLMLAPRVLPDYTWPVRVPIDVLRRQVADEFKRAAELAAQVFPAWTETRGIR
jgi:hypothetical protein